VTTDADLSGYRHRSVGRFEKPMALKSRCDRSMNALQPPSKEGKKKMPTRVGIFVATVLPILALDACRAPQSSDLWALGPFIKQEAYNPCLSPTARTSFRSPVSQQVDPVSWEARNVLNPAAVVRNGKVHLLYRAEDNLADAVNGTSRIGLAVSDNGLVFTRRPEPVLFPDNDAFLKYEKIGGIEDPRVVERADGTYFMTYTAYDGVTPRLCVASSRNLVDWRKHGPAFAAARNGKYLNERSKAGAIVCRRKGHRFIAAQIDGKYWMYWGDTSVFVATSDNLTDWKILERDCGGKIEVLHPRQRYFDSRLVEPGPQALLTDEGILLIYNGMNLHHHEGGDPDLPAETYAAGQALFDAALPTKLLKRSPHYFIRPERGFELSGQIDKVCFVEGLVYFQGDWFLYYGAADSTICVARYAPR